MFPLKPVGDTSQGGCYLASALLCFLNHSTAMTDSSFSRVPDFRPDHLTIADLEKIVRVMKNNQVKRIKFGAGNRLSVSGVKPETITAIRDQLADFCKPAQPGGITYVHACPGQEQCMYGIIDGTELGARIEEIELPLPLTAKVKVGIAGCHMCCTEPYIRDIGIAATRKGWRLIFGGNGGGRPRIGDVIAEGLTDEEVVELARRCLIFYQDNMKPKMRTARFMEEIGVDAFRQAVLTERFKHLL